MFIQKTFFNTIKHIFSHTHIQSCQISILVFQLTDNTFEVNLRRGPTGFGFSVQDGQSSTDPEMNGVVRIKKVFPLGPAAEGGQLKAGDVLLEVNEQPVGGRTAMVCCHVTVT